MAHSNLKWGLGIGDWGLGIGPNPQSPIPNPQSPIPNPQFIIFFSFLNDLIFYYFNYKYMSTILIKELQDKFTVTSNQIEYQLQQFDLRPTISQKKSILFELGKLSK